MSASQTYLALFAGVACMVAPEMQPQFEHCLNMLASVHNVPKAEQEASAASGFWPDNPDSYLASIRPYNVVDGVLQIPVQGVLMNNLPYQFGSYATGYEYIWQAWSRGMADPEVQGIALVVNSPGGAVAGNFDLVDRMFASRGVKPTIAIAAENMYSAAYSIGSVPDTVIVSRTGGVGSIGVVSGHIDVSKAMANDGVKFTFIYAGAHKVDGNPYEPLPKSVEARMQFKINELYGVFVDTVARQRGMDAQAVRDTEAMTFTATEGVANGLADSIGSLDDSLASFTADISKTTKGPYQMSISQETHDAAVASARESGLAAGRIEGHAAGRTEGHAAGLREGATAERARFSAILASAEGKTRPVTAMAMATDTDMSAEAVSAMLAKIPAEATATTATVVDPLNLAMDATGGGAGVSAEVRVEGGEGKGSTAAETMALIKAVGLPGFRTPDA